MNKGRRPTSQNRGLHRPIQSPCLWQAPVVSSQKRSIALGASMSRLEYASDNLQNIEQNTRAARSRVLDADYAKETTELARNQIIQQASMAILSQANQQQQRVLALLK
ncbi:MAG: flagellin [Cellvibrionales bacterium]